MKTQIVKAFPSKLRSGDFFFEKVRVELFGWGRVISLFVSSLMSKVSFKVLRTSLLNINPRNLQNSASHKTRCTRGDARIFFLYLQNVFVCTKQNLL